MTFSRSAPHPFPHENPSVLARRTSQTRKSIKKFYPVQTKDSTNPIMLHSANDDLYPRLWSFLAETMIAQGELSSDTKEAVALLVNSGRSCSVPRSDPETAEEQEEAERTEQAITYAESLLSSGTQASDDASFPLLNKAAKAEIALVVLLFSHLSRSVTSLLGVHHSSTGLKSVAGQPKSLCLDVGMRGIVRQMMAPINFSNAKPGLTNPLFSSSFTFGGGSGHLEEEHHCSLPDHLKTACHAGEDCAHALARLAVWVESFESRLLRAKVLTRDMLWLIKSAVPPAHLKSHQLPQWLSADLRPKKTLKGRSDLQWDIASLLLMVQYSPESVAKSSWLKEAGKALGKDKATTLVLWWSLRVTLAEAKGLRD